MTHPYTALPKIDPHGTRRAAFIQTIRDEDIMGSLRATGDDDLVHLGLGLAVEAYEGRWSATLSIAEAFYRIPADILELLAAATLTHLTPNMGAALLLRPNEATITDLRAILRRAGHDVSVTYKTISAPTTSR